MKIKRGKSKDDNIHVFWTCMEKRILESGCPASNTSTHGSGHSAYAQPACGRFGERLTDIYYREQ